MADRQLLFYTSLLLCLIHYGNSASVPPLPVLSFNPASPLQLTYNQTQPGMGLQLAITCRQPPDAGILSLVISKNSTSGVITTLLSAANAIVNAPGTDGAPVLDSSVTGATPSGTIKTDRFITLTYTAANCENAGIYICTSTVIIGNAGSTSSSSATYNVNVSPGQASIMVNAVTGPSGSGAWYLVGDEVTFTCSINVGTVESSSLQEVKFYWQYEVTSNFGGKGFENYPNEQDIDNSRPSVPSGSANCPTMTKTSILKRNLTIEDSGRQYKCYVGKGTNIYEAQAGFGFVSDVRESDEPNSGPQTGGGSSSTAKADVGMIVGIIIAILVVIAVVVVIVVFVIRHRRQQEQEGAYEPEKPAEPPVMSVPPPYTSEPPRFSRNDKPRGGHTNKAMDDEHDGKEPEKEKERSKHRDRGDRDPDRERRYDARPPRQEFEAGRRNPGFERNVDDPRGRRYSSDDGGTDVNRSISLGEGDHTIGSAV